MTPQNLPMGLAVEAHMGFNRQKEIKELHPPKSHLHNMAPEIFFLFANV